VELESHRSTLIGIAIIVASLLAVVGLFFSFDYELLLTLVLAVIGVFVFGRNQKRRRKWLVAYATVCPLLVIVFFFLTSHSITLENQSGRKVMHIDLNMGVFDPLGGGVFSPQLMYHNVAPGIQVTKRVRGLFGLSDVSAQGMLDRNTELSVQYKGYLGHGFFVRIQDGGRVEVSRR